MLLEGTEHGVAKIIWQCDCEHPCHTFSVCWWPNEINNSGEIYFCVRMSKVGFWKRLKYGIKYVLGKDVDDWFPYEEIVATPETIAPLISALQKCVDECKAK